MKVILFMAISMNGKITSGEDNVDWVTDLDVQRMDTLMKESKVMVMGSGTYNSFGDELPSDQALQVVMTSQSHLLHSQQDNVIFTDKEPKNVLKMLEDKDYSQVMLAGGEKLNTTFIRENLIDEIRVIFKPLVIGKGKSLFETNQEPIKLTLISTTTLEDGSLEVIYKVQKD